MARNEEVQVEKVGKAKLDLGDEAANMFALSLQNALSSMQADTKDMAKRIRRLTKPSKKQQQKAEEAETKKLILQSAIFGGCAVIGGVAGALAVNYINKPKDDDL